MKVLTIQMADDEWSTTHPMEKIASWGFKLHPEAALVTVQEHGGWWLTYTRCMSDNDLRIVGTANDMAQVSDFQRTFWEQNRNVPQEYLATIKR